jgi:uncharacterized protein
VRAQLAALAKLGLLDSSVRELEVELRSIPEALEQRRLDLQRLEMLLAKERDQLTEAERLRATHEQDIKDRNDVLARSKAKAAKAKNAREAEAAERETEAARRTIKEREEERDRLNTAMEQVQASLADHEKEFSDLRALSVEEEERGRTRMQELNAEKDKALVGRDAIVAQLTPAIVRRYEHIRVRKGSSAVAEIVDGTCTACRITLPAQQYIIVQRCETLEQCPSCVRIMYYRPALDDLLD